LINLSLIAIPYRKIERVKWSHDKSGKHNTT
jgi:hypothetical protein